MDNETIAINLIAGYLAKNQLPAAEDVDRVVGQLAEFYKKTVEELSSNDSRQRADQVDAKRHADKLKREGRP